MSEQQGAAPATARECAGLIEWQAIAGGQLDVATAEAIIREYADARVAEAVALARKALLELLGYTEQLELIVYDPSQRNKTHPNVATARVALVTLGAQEAGRGE